MSSKIDKIIKAEANREFNLACKLYEDYIFTSKKPELEFIINLLCIYFEAQDLGFAQEHKISGDTIAECYEKMQKLIEMSKVLHPNSIKLAFWINYVKYFYYGEEPYHVLDEKLYTQQAETLDPYIAFFSSTSKYSNKISQLAEEVKAGSTFRERLIKTMIVSN